MAELLTRAGKRAPARLHPDPSSQHPSTHHPSTHHRLSKRKGDIPSHSGTGSGMENKVMGTKRHSPYSTTGSKARSRLAPAAPLPSPSSSTSGTEMWAEGPDGRLTSVPANLPPALSWAEPSKLWTLMVAKADHPNYSRRPDTAIFSPALHADLTQPRIRAILLDWMLEVCEVYKLHRETFYLAVDFVDRFLSRTDKFTRSKLQLLGITALFAAAKLEEIYPPKCEEFAYVTDHACSDDEIRKFEGYLLQVLEWRLSPVTPLQWLTAFLQLFHMGVAEGAQPAAPSPSAFPSSRGRTAGLSDNPSCLLKPQFERQTFLVLVKVLDVLVMQEESLRWSYAVQAGAVLASLLASAADPVAEVSRVTGLPVGQLRECVEFLEPTVGALEESPDSLPPELRDEARAFPRTRAFDDVHEDDAHNIQTREATLRFYDYVNTRKDAAARLRASAMELSPDLGPLHNPYPTPPPSSERPTSPPHNHLLDITNH